MPAAQPMQIAQPMPIAQQVVLVKPETVPMGPLTVVQPFAAQAQLGFGVPQVAQVLVPTATCDPALKKIEDQLSRLQNAWERMVWHDTVNKDTQQTQITKINAGFLVLKQAHTSLNEVIDSVRLDYSDMAAGQGETKAARLYRNHPRIDTLLSYPYFKEHPVFASFIGTLFQPHTPLDCLNNTGLAEHASQVLGLAVAARQAYETHNSQRLQDVELRIGLKMSEAFAPAEKRRGWFK